MVLMCISPSWPAVRPVALKVRAERTWTTLDRDRPLLETDLVPLARAVPGRALRRPGVRP